MTKEKKEFETYLYIDNYKFKIFLFNINNSKNIYSDELILNNSIRIDFDRLSKFLDDNIFKIEKLSGKFVKDIFLIIENNSELHTNISIKKKNNNNITNKKNLNQALIELKSLFEENNQDRDIIHMLIENFIINGKNHKNFVENVKSDYLFLDINFITLSDKLIQKFDQILEKYQIKVKQFISGRYLKKLTSENDIEISLMAHKMRHGYNLNEIEIVPKIKSNKGFFEKFFQLFS